MKKVTTGTSEADEWTFIAGSATKPNKRVKQTPEQKADKKRIKELERELRRKEKALAETAALLVLGKKFDAYWKEKEDS